jgi:predicted O-linked N-acetylglucosamine transferase (SPINDLY family)
MAKPRTASSRTPRKSTSNIADLSSVAHALEESGDTAGAIKLYRDWLARTDSPDAWIAHFNVGVLLNGANDLAGAEESYTAAIALNPGYAASHVNLGHALDRQGRDLDAIAAWLEALKLLDATPNPDQEALRVTLNSLGRRLEALERIPEALTMLTRSLAVQPDQEIVLYHLIYLRQQQCEWPVLAPLPGISADNMLAAVSPVAMLAISDDPALQLHAAVRHREPLPLPVMPRFAPVAGYSHGRLRIGYLSSNFGRHPVSYLTAELYELHDRHRVEVFGFCGSPEDNSEIRRRVSAAMDHFIRIDQMSDEDAARAIRDAEIDILVDLQGHTAGARPNILAYHPAPVQIAYLGFPGTSGMPEIDYVLADRYVLTEESVRHFSEKPLYLPDCFQVNDRKRVAAAPLGRAEYGLPEDAFVFCTFNKNTKFNPEFFSAWMRILARTPNSVLWLLAADEGARENLVRYALAQGVGRERLIFAPRVPMARYLARFAVADLFLDISPFNGGTTVADALWMGLPVLTCSGRSFASRMGGSLLNAIGLPKLITTSLGDYEELAVGLAREPQRVKLLKSRLATNKNTHPLFDTPTFVRNLEDIFLRVAKTESGHEPASPMNTFDVRPFAEREIVFVVYAPAFHRTSGGVYALHAMAEDMYAMGCNVGMLAGAGMPGARVPLVSLEYLETMRAAGMTIVAIYPEIVTGNVLKADYAVWWLLNYPGHIKGNWDGSFDWADRVIGFGPELGRSGRCDSTLTYPLYDPDFFFPNDAIPKTEVTYYVNRIFSVAETIQAPVNPTCVLNPADNLSYRQLRDVLWRSKVVISNEWSGTLVMARLCGAPVIYLPSPLLSPEVQNTVEHRLGAAWGYSERNVELARQSLGALKTIHQERKATWLPSLAREVRTWIQGAKRKP